MWRTIANFLCGTLSQVRARGEVSSPWVDTGIAQGRVLSPLLFNLLVNSLAAAIRRASPGVRLLPLSDFRFTCQLYADDLVILAESEYDLQLALTAATLWGQQWRFSFGMGPEKSAAMVFGPARSRPSCSVFLSGQLLHVVSSYRYLGVVLTPSLRWDAHITHLISRGDRLFAQSTSWAHSEGLPASFTHFLLTTYVLPSATFGAEFIGDCTRSLAQLDFAQRRWGRHLLGWASGTPSASVLYELALPDSLRVSTGRALALFGRLHSLSSGTRMPLPATVFTLSLHTPGTWAHWCLSLLQHHAAGDPGQFGVGPRCSLTVTRRWLQRVVFPLLDRAWLRRLWRGLALLSNVRFILGVVRPYMFNRSVYKSSVDSGMVRWWGRLARHGRCAFVCVLHQSSRRPHSLSVVLPRLCRFAYPVVCSSPRGTNRSLFMDAALLDFQSAGFGEHPLRCARTHPVCWSGVCPRRLLQMGTC